jgi:hypothetical protein
MKIGIISDTHGCLDTWRLVFDRYFRDADLIIHAGDVLYHGPRNAIPAEYNPKELAEELNKCPVPLVIACGNCDAEVDGMVLAMPVQAPYAYVMADGRRIVVNHGHNLSEDQKWETAKRMKAAVLVTGHTHVAALEKRDGVVWVNPGAAAMTKREDKRGTVARIIDGRVEIIDINSDEILATEEL